MTKGPEASVGDLSLEEWLVALEDPDELTWTWAFPNDRLKSEYLDSISGRSDDEVRALLRHFLMPTGSLGIDESHTIWLEHLLNEDPERFEVARRTEWVRRLLDLDGSREPTWQGLTWILDLLPRWP